MCAKVTREEEEEDEEEEGEEDEAARADREFDDIIVNIIIIDNVRK